MKYFIMFICMFIISCADAQKQIYISLGSGCNIPIPYILEKDLPRKIKPLQRLGLSSSLRAEIVTKNNINIVTTVGILSIHRGIKIDRFLDSTNPITGLSSYSSEYYAITNYPIISTIGIQHRIKKFSQKASWLWK